LSFGKTSSVSKWGFQLETHSALGFGSETICPSWEIGEAIPSFHLQILAVWFEDLHWGKNLLQIWEERAIWGVWPRFWSVEAELLLVGAEFPLPGRIPLQLDGYICWGNVISLWGLRVTHAGRVSIQSAA
jgi:hypothetical protein